MFWLYIDSHDTEKVIALSTSVFWLVIPSLALFISLPLFLESGVGFYTSMSLSIVITIGAYYLMVRILRGFGISL